MGNSINIGRVFGVDIGIHWSWVFIFFVVTWSFATGVLDRYYPGWSEAQKWVGGAVVSIAFFLSVLAHEMSHAIVSNRNGLPVRSITLFVFGGVANLTREPDDPGLEFWIAIVGPLTSLVLGGFFAALWAALYNVNDGLGGICANLAIINVSLAAFNMLPGFPLDGGRVFRAIVWRRNHDRLRATRTASMAGEWIAYIVMGLGVLETFFVGWSGLWLVLVGFFLRSVASASYEQVRAETALDGVLARDVMDRDVPAVPPDLTLDRLVHDYMLRQHSRCYAVMAAGEFAGMVTLTDVRKVPREQWPATSVYRAMTPATRLHTVSPDDSLASVLRIMQEHDVNQIPVVHGRALIGILSRADVMRFIQLRQDLGETSRPSPDGATDSSAASRPRDEADIRS